MANERGEMIATRIETATARTEVVRALVRKGDAVSPKMIVRFKTRTSQRRAKPPENGHEMCRRGQG